MEDVIGGHWEPGDPGNDEDEVWMSAKVEDGGAWGGGSVGGGSSSSSDGKD